MDQRTLFEESVWEALRALDAAVAAGRPPAPNPALRPALSRLDELTRQLPPDVDGQLRHFLQRGSYQKARHWLEGIRD